jgi:hypothetical protein
LICELTNYADKKPSKSSKPKSSKSKKSKLDLLPSVSASSVNYEINRDGELPVNAKMETLSIAESQRQKEDLDADTLAVMSVDLTVPDENGVTAFDRGLGRAAVLAAPVPKFDTKDISVVRRKVGGADGEAKKVKTKKTKKSEGVPEDGEKANKKGKKKVAEIANEASGANGESAEKKSKKKKSEKDGTVGFYYRGDVCSYNAISAN